MLALSLLLVGVILRFVPHAPNFTPVAAIALFGGVYLKRKNAVIIPLLLMITSDLVIGMHNVIFFTWGSFVLISFIGIWLTKRKTVLNIFSTSIVSSILFYIITNFGVWAMGWYPATTAGLIQCYVMGLPFLRDFTLATIIYAAVFFGAYEFIASKVRNTKLAKVLLTTL